MELSTFSIPKKKLIKLIFCAVGYILQENLFLEIKKNFSHWRKNLYAVWKATFIEGVDFRTSS